MTTKTSKSQMVAVRLPHELVAEIDEYKGQLEQAADGIPINRTEVIRSLIVEALASRKAARSRRR